MANLEKPPGLSKIRERSLTRLLDRRAAYLEKADQTLLALQDRRSADLSLGELARQRQAYAYHQSRLLETDDLIKRIRQQNALVDADRAANPLRPAARRQPSTAAILGLLERERRRNAPLSRGAYARAQATAASRSKYDLKQAYRRSGSLAEEATFRGEVPFYALRGVDVSTPPGPDPCVEYRRVQRNRREVMFAQGLAGRGYSVSHRKSPC